MVAARGEHTATLLSGGRVLVAGGYDNHAGALSSVELYSAARTAVTLRAQPRTLATGAKLRLSGAVSSVVSLAGVRVQLTVQRKVRGKWRDVKTLRVPLGAAGRFGATYRPPKPGAYHVQASVAAGGDRLAGKSPYRSFRVVVR